MDSHIRETVEFFFSSGTPKKNKSFYEQIDPSNNENIILQSFDSYQSHGINSISAETSLITSSQSISINSQENPQNEEKSNSETADNILDTN
jgi:hypothetical protein